MAQIKLQKLSSGIIDVARFALSSSLSSYSTINHLHDIYTLTSNMVGYATTGSVSAAISNSHLQKHEITSTDNHIGLKKTIVNEIWVDDGSGYPKKSSSFLYQYSLTSHNHNQYTLTSSMNQYSLTSHEHDFSTTSYEKIGISIDGGGSIPLTGFIGNTYIPWPCTATQIVLLADQIGNIEFDIMKSSYADYPSALTIVGTNKPEIVGNIKNKITDFSNWNYEFSEDDILQFNINSVSAITRCTLTIQVIK